MNRFRRQAGFGHDQSVERRLHEPLQDQLTALIRLLGVQQGVSEESTLESTRCRWVSFQAVLTVDGAQAKGAFTGITMLALAGMIFGTLVRSTPVRLTLKTSGAARD